MQRSKTIALNFKNLLIRAFKALNKKPSPKPQKRDKNMLIGCLLFATGYILSWFSLNAQFAFKSAIISSAALPILLSIPMTLLFWYGSSYVFAATGGLLWTKRLIAFGIGYLIFPGLTWAFMSESPFTIKTMISMVLAIAIVLIQVMWT